MSSTATQMRALFVQRRWVVPAMIIANLLFVVCNLVLILALSRTVSTGYFARILVVIGAVYAIAAVIKDNPRVIAIEMAFFTVIIVMSLLGARQSIWWLAAGYFAHGLWDLLHIDHEHSNHFGTRRLPFWYPPVCVIYDWLVALLIAFVAVGLIG